MIFTVLGGSGFIGQHLSAFLIKNGHTVKTPSRKDIFSLSSENLGHVIYAIGMTSNFMNRPSDTLDAHINIPMTLLPINNYDSFTYLSSTKIYEHSSNNGTADENTKIYTDSAPESLFSLSKMVGESICLSHKNSSIRVVRPSNIYGTNQSQNTFLASVLKDAVSEGSATILEDKESGKDYLSVSDLCSVIMKVSTEGRDRLYNIASGKRITHKEISDFLATLGYNINFLPSGKKRLFPEIDIRKIKDEFNFIPRSLIDDLPTLINDWKMRIR